MADKKIRSEATIVAMRLISDDGTKTMDSDGTMKLHSAISNYGTDGLLSFTSAASPAGGNSTEYTITLPVVAVTGNADPFRIALFTQTPAYTGGLIVGALPETDWIDVVLDDEGNEVNTASLAEGGGGGGGSSIIIPVTVATSVTDKPEVPLDNLARNSSPTVQITFTDQDGEPSDLDGHTIKARIKKPLDTTTLFDISCTVGGADDNIVSFPVSQASTATEGTYFWDLWDTTANDTLIKQSVFNVVDAAQAIA